MWSGLVACVSYWYVLYVIWYVLFVICYLLTILCCMLSVVAENDGEFDDKLWPNDDEVAPNDGICGSRIGLLPCICSCNLEFMYYLAPWISSSDFQ
jgi:hypothetical protein